MKVIKEGKNEMGISRVCIPIYCGGNFCIIVYVG